MGKAASLAESLPQESLLIRFVVDGTSPRPSLSEPESPLDVRVEEDPFEFRGTAGVLKDLTKSYNEEDFVLVANASQPPLGGQQGLVSALIEAKGIARVLIDRHRSPTGLVLIKVGCLESVSEVGYVDLKEQALPAIAKDEWVSAVTTEERFLEPIRNRETYLAAVRAFHLGSDEEESPYRETWRSTFSLVEDGAEVAKGAKIHDSVVLAGAKVGEDAVVARSVVCPGQTVMRGEVRVDETVANGKVEPR
jgi:NDP-sugar pyrophosphorylase family protein